MASNIELANKKIAELQKALDRKHIEMRSIKQIGKSLSSELRTEKLLLLIIDEVSRLMNAERSTLYVVDEEQGELWSKIAQKAEIKEIRLKIGVGIAGHVAQTGQVINIPDAYNDERFDPTTDKKTGYRTRSILTMPIFEPLSNERKKPKIIGVLQTLNKKDKAFDAADEELLASLCSQIAIALINSRLYTALEKKVNEINLLFDIEKELNKAYNLEELLRFLVVKLTRALHVEAALIALGDDQSEEFNGLVTQNNDEAVLNECRLNSAKGIIGEVVRKGQFYVSNDIRNDPLFAEDPSRDLNPDIVQLVCAPLMIGKQVIGILEVFNKPDEHEFFRNDDVRLIISLASQISRSIEAYRLRDEKIKAERLASIGNMMSTIVHDLRTPMNNIQGFVELLTEEEEENLRQEYAEIVNQQIKILTNMTRDVLDFAKGKTSILPVKYPVNKIIDEFVKLFKNDIIKKGFAFNAECNASSNVYVDPEKINRVFMNIMKNALEAMDEGGRFSIVANQVNGDIEFLLSDTGKGIPEEIRDRLFDSFVTSGKKEGTGLGLAIVKKIIDEHKGRIEVESETGKGTTFKIYIKKI